MGDLIGNRTVPGLLDEVAERRADQPFLVFEAADGSVSELTYGELRDRVRRTAQGLANLGVGKGDKVVVHLGNCTEFVLALLGIAELGAVMVPSNVAHTAREVTYTTNRSDAVLVITSSAFAELFAQVLADAPAVRAVVMADDAGASLPVPVHPFSELLESPPLGDRPSIDAEDPLQILFTSGTTASPKGVVLTHANCLWCAEREARQGAFRPEDRLLIALPLFHVNAQNFALWPALAAGAAMILIERYSASEFWAQVRRHRATHTSLVAMLARTLLRQEPSPLDGEHELRTVAYAINVTDAEKQEFEERFGVELINAYGLSEAMATVCTAPLYGERRWPSVGRPAIDREVRIVDENGQEVPPGTQGEIVVRGVPGRTIMAGYYKDPEATARTVVDGWLHTGDNGWMDADGFVYFVDRLKDIIKQAGENVSATEVESVLVGHPRVVQAAVIGVPDPIRDEVVKAFVVVDETDGPVTEDELTAYCSERLARFKVPSIFEFRSSLPMTSIGKIEKKVLRQEAAAAAPPAPLEA